MSIYIIVFFVLILFAGLEFWQKQSQEVLYRIGLCILTLMLCLRFGQGTDYFNYYINFLNVPPLTDPAGLANTNIHGEKGWLYLTSLWKTLGLSYEALVVAISLLIAVCIHRFISRFSPMKCITLLLVYPTLYLTYAMSSLRQGIALYIFLGFMLNDLVHKRYLRYILLTLVLSTIHNASLLLLAVPILAQYRLDMKSAVGLMIASFALGLGISTVLPKISSVFAYYSSKGSIGILALSERLITASILVFAFQDFLAPMNRERKTTLLMNIYLYGTMLYLLLSWNDLIASRIGIFFKALEVVLLAIAIQREGVLRRWIGAYCLALVCIMCYKNLGAYIREGQYYAGVSVWKFPYVTLFNKAKILDYRNIVYAIKIK